MAVGRLVQASIALPFPSLTGEQPAVGNAQLPLGSGPVSLQLLSSLDPLEHSASLSLVGSTGEQGNCLGAFQARSLSVSMESLDFGLAHLWCLCVLGQGQGHPAAGPVAGVARGVMVCSLGALCQPQISS